MRIWIDLSNSPHVPFFLPLAAEFESRGHEVIWTARDYAQTVELADESGLRPEVFGRHGGGSLIRKATEFAKRTLQLVRWMRNKEIDLVVVHNSQEPLIAARMLGVESVDLMDYEFHPGNRLSFRAANRLVLPSCFPGDVLKRLGISEQKVRRYDGIKEDVYLAAFESDTNFAETLEQFGVRPEDILVVVRPHAPDALYNRSFQNDLIDVFIDRASKLASVKLILLPRTRAQGDQLRERHSSENVIIPDRVLDGANLMNAADLVVSGGGTMNREAAVLGVPTATIFTGRMSAVDKYLIEQGSLLHLSTMEDIEGLRFEKKGSPVPRRSTEVLQQVTDLILLRDGENPI